MYELRRSIDRRMRKLKMPKCLKEFVVGFNLSEKKDFLLGQDSFDKLMSISPSPKGTSIVNRRQEKINYDLSIVVPAYNVSQYVADCIKSLIDQDTEYKYQIILINDGSTDGTRDILLDYSKKYPTNIIFIDQGNKGLSGARNVALNYVSGRYITFVDTDDVVTSKFVQSLLKVAYEQDADIVEGSYQVIDVDDNVIQSNIHFLNTNVNAFKALYGYPWGKAYRSSLLNDIQFPEGFWYEDTMQMYRLWPKANKIITIPEIIYRYRKNPQGITNDSKGKVKALDSLYITIRLLEDCNVEHIALDGDLYNFTLSQMAMNFLRIQDLDENILKNAFNVITQTIDKFFPADVFKTSDVQLRKLEESLRNKDYKKFVVYCIML
ncbi:glycosyltransferase family 2 protein [Limosilactobacillus fermentum]|uniref:glycosyltransferase family 2 protein n=1 Tax=Limosilactobacillus fermentum TaxID=1613 RepID=UPI001F4598E0|nr:glycosyltransferase family 2 protein [Limosilactobacillus fermentum]UJP15615.1 glycosyltransferase [Limosilactobacillus fermentum]